MGKTVEELRNEHFDASKIADVHGIYNDNSGLEDGFIITYDLGKRIGTIRDLMVGLNGGTMTKYDPRKEDILYLLALRGINLAYGEKGALSLEDKGNFIRGIDEDMIPYQSFPLQERDEAKIKTAIERLEKVEEAHKHEGRLPRINTNPIYLGLIEGYNLMLQRRGEHEEDMNTMFG